MSGILYLVPNALGEGALDAVLPLAVARTAARLDYFVAENAKSTRAFLKRVDAVAPLERAIRDVEIAVLDVATPVDALPALLAPIVAGRDGGLISEAGCPAVADPGAALVALAHRHAVRVVPLVGPSSIVLALMASGLDGQRFAFRGYLPTDAAARIAAIRDAEERSSRDRETQIFIETPYRNDALLTAFVAACRPTTRLSVACDLTLPTETIATRPIDAWRTTAIDLAKRPAIFCLLAG